MEGTLLHLLLARLACYDFKNTDADISVTSVFLLEDERAGISSPHMYPC